MIMTAVTKMAGENFHAHFSDGSILEWDPDNSRVLRDPVHSVTIMGGPRFEAWQEYRDHQPSPGDLCCIHAKRVICVCIQATSCIIHGSFHYGTHD